MKIADYNLMMTRRNLLKGTSGLTASALLGGLTLERFSFRRNHILRL